MKFRSVRDADFENQKVLIRVDFNIEVTSIAQGKEHFKIEVSKATIDYIMASHPATVALITHFGSPDGEKNPDFSVQKLLPIIERILGRPVVFVDDCVGEKVETALANLPAGTLLVLENVRFYPEEEKNDLTFAEALAKPFTLYVNESFGVDHRSHASLTGITKFLPAYAGLRVLEETSELDKVLSSPKRPAVAVIGGAKIKTKLPLIRVFEEKYDHVLVGGKIANEAIDQKIVFSEKVLLPQDFDSSSRLDIGPDTIARYIQIIKTAKTIVWNGPMGKFEEKPYDIGTDAVLRTILESAAFTVIGGGESLAVLEKANVIDKIGFVSSGGGAMLEYLGGKELPALKVLEA